jgi:hypothetical protein
VAGPHGLPVIPSPRQGGMMGFAVNWPAGSIRYGATTPSGGHDLHDPRLSTTAENEPPGNAWVLGWIRAIVATMTRLCCQREDLGGCFLHPRIFRGLVLSLASRALAVMDQVRGALPPVTVSVAVRKYCRAATASGSIMAVTAIEGPGPAT